MTGFGDAVASAGPYANSLHLTPCRQITTPTPHRSIFTGRMLFLTPNQQCQSTEGTNNVLLHNCTKIAFEKVCNGRVILWVSQGHQKCRNSLCYV